MTAVTHLFGYTGITICYSQSECPFFEHVVTECLAWIASFQTGARLLYEIASSMLATRGAGEGGFATEAKVTIHLLSE